jgi:hypothetical protein
MLMQPRAGETARASSRVPDREGGVVRPEN